MNSFELLLTDLDAIDGCPTTKRRVRDVLLKHAGARITISQEVLVRDAESERKARMIGQLKRQNYPRSEIVRMVAVRFGVSRRAARNWVSVHE